MSRKRTVIWILALLAVVTIASFALFLFVALPDPGPLLDIRVEHTPERIQRGRYLANHVMVCMDCHSERDWNHFAGPVVPGTLGQGGERFGRDAGFPGEIYAPNITPAAVGHWSDAQLARAITSGVDADGRALFPLMPYPDFGTMSQEDLSALIAYLRTVQPIEHQVPATSLDFPLDVIVRTIPRPSHLREHTPTPDQGVGYGSYLVELASCEFCHTPVERGGEIAGMQFAGGHEFPGPWGVVTSANITPDPATGIGSWSREQFVRRFKSFEGTQPQATPPGTPNTIMPWTMFAGMTEQDLGAIYDYLRTVAPVHHEVHTFDTTASAPQQGS